MTVQQSPAMHWSIDPAAPMARRLAHFALGIDARTLPPNVSDKARGCLFDFLGCALEAGDLPWGRQIRAYAALGPQGPASVIGAGLKVGAAEAAFVNGALGHGLIREDMHVSSCTHLGVVVWPALLALSQQQPGTAGDFLSAAVAGYEVGARVGQALFDSDLAARLRPTGTVGAIAAAAAGARLLRLDIDQATSAIGLAANMAGGVNEWPWAGGTEVFFHAGGAARGGVTAALLARCGVFASPTAIDGRAGLFAAFGRRERVADIDLSDERHEILSVYWKPAPACNYVQTPCQAALALVEQGVQARDIRRVRIASFRAALDYPGCDQPGPYAGVLEAKMSLQYAVAATLVHRRVTEANYARLDHPDVLRLAGATHLHPDPAFEAAFPAKQGVEITVELADGTTRAARLDDVTAVSAAGVRERFAAVAAARLGAAQRDALLSRIDSLPEAGDPAMIATLACGLPAAR